MRAPSSRAARARRPTKIAALKAAGVTLAETPSALGSAMARTLEKRGLLAGARG
jgi:succinyl-CoA synthetase alpha subunit